MYNPHHAQPLPELLTLAEQQNNTLALAIHNAQPDLGEPLRDAIEHIAQQIIDQCETILADSCKPDGYEYCSVVDMLNDSAPDEHQLETLLTELNETVETESYKLPHDSPFSYEYDAYSSLEKFITSDRDYHKLMRDIHNDASATFTSYSYDCAPASRAPDHGLYLDSHHIGEIQIETDTFLDDLPDSIRPLVQAITGDTVYLHSDVIIDINLSTFWLANWLKEYYA